jgi:hypothetical protein
VGDLKLATGTSEVRCARKVHALIEYSYLEIAVFSSINSARVVVFANSVASAFACSSVRRVGPFWLVVCLSLSHADGGDCGNGSASSNGGGSMVGGDCGHGGVTGLGFRVSMCVCMYVCVFVGMYVCMHVCMYVCV